jgi:hypothetical protein
LDDSSTRPREDGTSAEGGVVNSDERRVVEPDGTSAERGVVEPDEPAVFQMP